MDAVINNVNLAAVTLPQLAALYNELADAPVKRFSQRDAAERRVLALGQASAMRLCYLGEGGPVGWEPAPGNVAAEAEAEAPVPYAADEAQAEAEAEAPEAAAEPAQAEAQAPARRKGPTPTYADDLVVTVLAEGNPKRGASAARFALYRTGMTVGEYLDACAAAAGGQRTRWRADLPWDAAHGWIKVGPRA